jgi:hypothetical protein
LVTRSDVVNSCLNHGTIYFTNWKLSNFYSTKEHCHH